MARSRARARLNCSSQGDDYAPEETVHLHGGGFAPDAPLTVKVTRPDGSVVSGDGTFEPWPKDYDSVRTDWRGGFHFDYILNGVLGEYLVEVLDEDGDILASHMFTDGHVVEFTVNGTWGPVTANGGDEASRVDAGYDFAFCIGNVGTCSNSNRDFFVLYRNLPDRLHHCQLRNCSGLKWQSQ